MCPRGQNATARSLATSEVVSERTAVAFLGPEDVRNLYPHLSEDEAEQVVAWLGSNCTLADRPELAKALIQEAIETIGIGSAEDE